MVKVLNMRLLFYFFFFFLAHSVVQSYMFWITKQTPKLSLFNYEFSNVWIFWIAAVCLATPFLNIANLTFGATFYYGYKHTQTAWIMLLTYIAAQTLAYPAMVYFWFHELPNKGAIIGGLLAIAGVLVANFWKH